jgi:hypothetical protein
VSARWAVKYVEPGPKARNSLQPLTTDLGGARALRRRAGQAPGQHSWLFTAAPAIEETATSHPAQGQSQAGVPCVYDIAQWVQRTHLDTDSKPLELHQGLCTAETASAALVSVTNLHHTLVKTTCGSGSSGSAPA